jgi:hypothetical protein
MPTKLLNVHYDGSMENLSTHDVQGLELPVEVRSTSHEGGCLLLHPKDKDDNIFVLLTGVAPNFKIRGWLYAKDGKNENYWMDIVGRRPAYFVPQEALKPIEELLEKLNINVIEHKL